jgi:cardiolipin synthase C
VDLALASWRAEALSTVIAEVARTLSADHVEAWARVLRREPFAAGPAPDTEAQLIGAKPGFALAGAAGRLTEAWRVCDPPPPGEAVALALDAAAAVNAQYAAWRSDVVVSGPVSEALPVRLTSSVISEVIHDSRESLLIVSFAAFGVADVVAELVVAGGRGVQIDLVMEETEAQGGTLRGTVGAAAAFSSLRPYATLWKWPSARRPTFGTARAALHAKLLAADNKIAVVGSANLTDRALAQNIELGIIIRDPQVVQRMVGHFRSLMRPEHGPLEQA